jgi:hypothetical protein
MKAILFILFLPLILFSCNNNTKQNATALKADTIQPVTNKLIKDTVNTILTDSITVYPQDSVNENDILVNGIKIITAHKDQFEDILKHADSVTRDSNDMMDCIFKTYHFKNSTLCYCDKNITYFDLSDNYFSFSVNGKKIQIGDMDDIIKTLFPKSYATAYAPASQGDTTMVQILIRNSNQQTLDFSISTRKRAIVDISMTEDYD